MSDAVNKESHEPASNEAQETQEDQKNNSKSEKTYVSDGQEKSIQFAQVGAPRCSVDGKRNISMLMDLELPVAVELGRIRMLVKDILELGPGAVVELNKFSGEPVDLYINAKKFAEGEVVIVGQNVGVRITALIAPGERLANLK